MKKPKGVIEIQKFIVFLCCHEINKKWEEYIYIERERESAHISDMNTLASNGSNDKQMNTNGVGRWREKGYNVHCRTRGEYIAPDGTAQFLPKR